MPAFTTLNAVKAWLSITTTSTDDLLLTGLISQISGGILNYLQRPPLMLTTFTELRSGVGNRSILLRNWPVVSINSLVVNQFTIPAAPAIVASTPGTSYYPNITTPLSGYALETWDGTPAGVPQELSLCGYDFCRGRNNIQIVYQAGYCIQNEAQTVPSSGTYSLVASQPMGAWAADNGVTYVTSGIALQAQTSNAALNTGQYYVDPNSGIYYFCSGDAGAQILINYSFTPFALGEAAIEWVSERYKYRSRIGMVSQSLGGNETAAYNLRMPDHVKTMIDPFRKEFPL
jgi:hypothetical protein